MLERRQNFSVLLLVRLFVAIQEPSGMTNGNFETFFTENSNFLFPEIGKNAVGNIISLEIF